MTRFPIRMALVVTSAALSLAACSGGAEAPAGNKGSTDSAASKTTAVALVGPDGSNMGTIAYNEDTRSLTIRIDARGLSAGTHGVHLHEKGLCDGPKFESAGAHLNPGKKQHGRDNPMGAHLGDLDNLKVANAGGPTTLTAPGVTMNGTNALADADGTSVVVHAKADDYKTDPSGASGDRVACAVVAAPRG